MRAAQNPEPRPNARRADTSAQGRREAQRRCVALGSSPATMPVHATAARAGWVPLPGKHQGPILEFLPRTMIVP